MSFPSSRASSGSVDGYRSGSSPLASPRLSLDIGSLRISSPKSARAQTGLKSPFGAQKNAGALDSMSLDNFSATNAPESSRVIDVRQEGMFDSNWNLSSHGSRAEKPQQAAPKEAKSPRILRAVLSRSKEAFKQIVTSTTKGYAFKDFDEVQQVWSAASQYVILV